MKIIKYLSVMAIAAIFSSCSQEGPAGPTGPQGDPGTNGVANISTSTYTVTTGNWTDPSNNENWISSWTANAITDQNNDAVVGYWSTSSGGPWTLLPFTDLQFPSDQLSFYFSTGFINFTYFTGGPNWTLPPSAYTTTQFLYFNIITIPPAVQSKHPGTNWQNMSEVANIPEVKAALNNSSTK